jgi:hypothetical protein
MMPLVRRPLAVLIAALLAGVFALVGTSASAGAAPTVKGYLHIVSIADQTNPQDSLPEGDRPFDIVKGRFFDVKVEVRDAPNGAGQLVTVTRATVVALKALSGPGKLGNTLTATIERDASTATIRGATYSEYANDVELQVVVVKGVDLAPSEIVPVDVALTAISETVNPLQGLDLQDPNCAVPTADKPTCGRLLLPKGSTGNVLMSVGSCAGLADCRGDGATEALVVTAVFSGVYAGAAPASVVLACDKVICGQSGAGLPQLPVIYTFLNGGDLDLTTEGADPCPAKGVLGQDQEICVDYVQSSRHQGDLYTHVLLGHDVRLSHP